MAHEYPAEPMMKEKKGSGKISNIHIRCLDDGSYLYSVSKDNDYKGKEYSYKSVGEICSALKDDLADKKEKSSLKEEIKRK